VKTALPRAVLLDLDDTILDDSGRVDSCWEEACLGCDGDGRMLSEIRTVRDWYWSDPDRHRLGRLDLETARRAIVRMALERLESVNDVLAAKIAARYTELRDLRVTLVPGAVETLTWLKSHGCRLALLTNGASAAQRMKIARFGLEMFFDRILIEGEVGFGKPDERVYRTALSEMDIAPDDAWMVGDNLQWDVEPAQKFGMRAIWVDVQGNGLPKTSSVRPDQIVRKLSELRNVD
jgi:putative hydrolase of the HAD superfamily